MMGKQFKAYLALVFICLVWGTTYLAVRIGVKDFPPFLFMGIRQIIAGFILFFIVLMVGKEIKLNWQDIKSQTIPGLCMITFGNGIVAWSVQYIPSGLAALICSMIPLYVVMMNLVVNKQDKLNWQIISGIVFGLVGVGIIFKDHVKELGNSAYLAGIIITILSSVFWAFGTIYNQNIKTKKEPFLNSAIQLLIGGVGLMIMSLIFEDYNHIPLVTNKTIWALIYLILVGSAMGFSAYVYALSRLPVGLVVIYAYLNPLVAIILGFIILNEPITYYTIVAFCVTISGVYLVNKGYRKQKILNI